MTEGLLRQRRNLVAISAALLLFHFAEVSIGEVSVLGTNLLVGKPAVVYAFLWLLWAYFLLRYTQYLCDEKDRGFRRDYVGRVELRITKYLERQIDPNDKLKYQNTGYWNLEHKGFLKWDLPLRSYEPGDIASVKGTLAVPATTFLSARILAVLGVLFITPRATDFILPFLVAVLAPVVTIFSWRLPI